ncbi:hypothetical protein EOW77_0030650 [Bradyrhizobium yuanmingense]|nr:hypothetical protein EOW77_0030650 [Bradyrhizobium yuanmingense]
MFDDEQHQDSFRRIQTRADVRTLSPSVKELPLPLQGRKMGNGSIVPRQERFDIKHALCCISARADCTWQHDLENILGLKQFGAMEYFRHPRFFMQQRGADVRLAMQKGRRAA